MSNPGFYHNPAPNVSGLAKKVEGSVTQVTLGKTIPFDLYTHCGIGEIKAFGRYYERVGGPLSDGFGNPPKGWGNPYDSGTLSAVGDSAIFRDSHGHEVDFTLRPNATGFSTMCS